jgi:hypothetical protein
MVPLVKLLTCLGGTATLDKCMISAPRHMYSCTDAVLTQSLNGYHANGSAPQSTVGLRYDMPCCQALAPCQKKGAQHHMQNNATNQHGNTLHLAADTHSLDD